VTTQTKTNKNSSGDEIANVISNHVVPFCIFTPAFSTLEDCVFHSLVSHSCIFSVVITMPNIDFKLLLRYGIFKIAPSAIMNLLYVYLYQEYLVLFIIVQNLVGISGVFQDLTQRGCYVVVVALAGHFIENGTVYQSDCHHNNDTSSKLTADCCTQTLHYIKTIYSGLSKNNCKDHYGD